jgi:hypothetical protein
MRFQVRRVLGSIAAAVVTLAVGSAWAQTPEQVQYIPGDTKAVIVWMAPATGTATGYNVYQYEPATPGGDLGTGKKITATPITTTSYTVEGLTNGKPYHFAVSAIVDGTESDQVGPAPTYQDPPYGDKPLVIPQVPVKVGGVDGFVGYTIGTNFPGSHSIAADGTINMTGHGWDIWDNTDGFYFLATPMEGNLTISARVVSGPTPIADGGNGWELGGTMIRESLDARSRFAMMQISQGRQSTTHQFKRRQTFDTQPVNDDADTSVFNTEDRPVWARLTRNGDEFHGFVSKDGTEWVEAGSGDTITDFAKTAYVGLALTAHNQPDTGETTSVVFDNVTITKQ